MEREIDLRELFAILKQHIVWIVLAAVIGGLAGFLGTYFFVTPVYTASASLYVSNNQRNNTAVTSSDLTAAQNLVDTYIVILKSDTVLTKVADMLPYGESAKQLREKMTASAIDGTEAFQVSITDPDPVAAQTTVNAITQVAPDEIIRVSKAGAVEVIDHASLPEKSQWPLKRNAAIGLLLGLVISVAAVVAHKILDVTVRAEEDLKKRYELPVLGAIPAMESGGSKNSAEKKDIQP